MLLPLTMIRWYDDYDNRRVFYGISDTRVPVVEFILDPIHILLSYQYMSMYQTGTTSMILIMEDNLLLGLVPAIMIQ